MSFNSDIFLFVFFPATLTVFFLLRARGLSSAALCGVLSLASAIFYAWWDLRALALIGSSVAINWYFGQRLIDHRNSRVLCVAVFLNLLAIAVFKYLDFLLFNVNALSGTNFAPLELPLPLGISFFTFQQIAFLVDAYHGRVKRADPHSYTLFVVFFPQLVAGPIVHHATVTPYYTSLRQKSANRAENLAIGLSMFIIGLAKKVLLADYFAQHANGVFDGASSAAVPLSFDLAWTGALAYTLQIYFDFSGYSDMAMGLARCFGVQLPVNFNAPYRALSIIDFWRRWHITLSHFLRDYLYIPLGGNRTGTLRRFTNLMLVMFLGGLWHGAGWTFVAWGVLHGFYLCINHLWRAARLTGHSTVWIVPCWSVTFIAVVIAWVFFRAATFTDAARILSAMAGAEGFSSLCTIEVYTALSFGIAIVVMLPDTAQLFFRYLDESFLKTAGVRPFIFKRRCIAWTPQPIFATLLAVLLFAVIINLWTSSDFIYSQF